MGQGERALGSSLRPDPTVRWRFFERRHAETVPRQKQGNKMGGNTTRRGNTSFFEWRRIIFCLPPTPLPCAAAAAAAAAAAQRLALSFARTSFVAQHAHVVREDVYVGVVFWRNCRDAKQKLSKQTSEDFQRFDVITKPREQDDGPLLLRGGCSGAVAAVPPNTPELYSAETWAPRSHLSPRAPARRRPGLRRRRCVCVRGTSGRDLDGGSGRYARGVFARGRQDNRLGNASWRRSPRQPPSRRPGNRRVLRVQSRRLVARV